MRKVRLSVYLHIMETVHLVDVVVVRRDGWGGHSGPTL